MSFNFRNDPSSASPTASPKRRRTELDLSKLVRKYKVNFICGTKEFLVIFEGPLTSPYEGGLWAVRINMPESYPFHSPSVGFINRIYHPNVDEASGSVCLDVINQKWSSIFDLCHIFDHFLPQLMQEPNISDPLNQVAAQQMSKDRKSYDMTVKDYILRYAKECHLVKAIKESCPDPPTDDEISTQLGELLTVRRASESTSFTSSVLQSNSSFSMHNNSSISIDDRTNMSIFQLEMEESPKDKQQSLLNNNSNAEISPSSSIQLTCAPDEDESMSSLSEYDGSGAISSNNSD